MSTRMVVCPATGCSCSGAGLRFRHGLLPGIVLRHSGHQGGMGLIAVLAVLLDPCLLLECLHGSFRFAAELTIHLKGGTQLVQQFLQGLDVSPGRTVLQQSASQRIHGDRFHGDLCTAGVAVVNKWQLV